MKKVVYSKPMLKIYVCSHVLLDVIKMSDDDTVESKRNGWGMEEESDDMVNSPKAVWSME